MGVIGVLLVLGVVFSIFATMAYYRYYLEDEAQKYAWKIVARSRHLTFRPGNFWGKRAYVTGSYRGYQLKLETFPGEKSDTYTRVTLFVKRKDSSCQHADPANEQAVIRQFTTSNLPYPLKGKVYATCNGQQIYYDQPGFETDGEYLDFIFDLLSNFADSYPAVMALGGEGILLLQGAMAVNQNDALQPLMVALLRDIALWTKAQFSYRLSHFICLTCFHHFGAHKIPLDQKKSITYYGCRACRQSRKSLEVQAGGVIASLDGGMVEEYRLENERLHVNWLILGKLFDFDAVEIINASDEAVERFAVQVGNDTDEFRQPRYKQMDCVVAADCRLSRNTMRILERMFGRVIRHYRK